MVVLGEICIKDFLQNTGGKVRGKIFTDGKDRYYSADYKWVEADDFITISRADGNGVEVRLRNKIPLDEKLIAFFGLYSGDGAKGVDDPSNQSRIIPNISFSQKTNRILYALQSIDFEIFLIMFILHLQLVRTVHISWLVLESSISKNHMAVLYLK